MKLTFLYKLSSYYLLPHELLHVFAHWLIGKPCHYEWGNHYVTPLAKMKLWEQLFTSLFPFITCLGMGLIFSLTWLTMTFFMLKQPDYHLTLTWHVILLVMGLGLVFYSSTAEGDLIQSYQLLFPKEPAQDNRPEPHGSPKDNPQQRQ